MPDLYFISNIAILLITAKGYPDIKIYCATTTHNEFNSCKFYMSKIKEINVKLTESRSCSKSNKTKLIWKFVPNELNQINHGK